jgi:hypothetical protein
MDDGSDDILDSDRVFGSDAPSDRDDPWLGWIPWLGMVSSAHMCCVETLAIHWRVSVSSEYEYRV